jgi:hypothetical protein
MVLTRLSMRERVLHPCASSDGIQALSTWVRYICAARGGSHTRSSSRGVVDEVVEGGVEAEVKREVFPRDGVEGVAQCKGNRSLVRRGGLRVQRGRGASLQLEAVAQGRR